jgi:hypothetical protein
MLVHAINRKYQALMENNREEKLPAASGPYTAVCKKYVTNVSSDMLRNNLPILTEH